MLRAFLKDSAVYTVPAFVSRALGLLTVPLYTRVLSPADYGSFDLFMIFSSIVTLTVALEVSQGLARYYASTSDKNQRIAYASSAFWFSVFCYTLFLVLAFSLTSWLSGLVMGRPGQEVAYRIGLVYIWLNGIFNLILMQFRWELRSRQFAVASLLLIITTLIVAIWFTYWFHWGLAGLMLGMVAGCAIGNIYGLWQLRHSIKLQFSKAKLLEMLVFSWPLVPSGIAVWLNMYVGRILINYFMSVADVGLYGVGARIASIAALLSVGVQASLTPLIYTYYREPATPLHLAQIFRLFLMSALLVFMTLTLFSQEILCILTTPEFYGGAVVVIYLVPAFFLSQMYIFSPGIGIAKKTHLIAWINIAGATVNIMLNYLLIPHLGIPGAGISTLCAAFCVFISYMCFSQRFYPVPHKWDGIFVTVISSAVITAILVRWDLHGSIHWVINIVSMLAIFVIGVLAGVVKVSELKWVQHKIYLVLK
jgi:O-antigen/teichoic acid export membrane protein